MTLSKPMPAAPASGVTQAAYPCDEKSSARVVDWSSTVSARSVGTLTSVAVPAVALTERMRASESEPPSSRLSEVSRRVLWTSFPVST